MKTLKTALAATGLAAAALATPLAVAPAAAQVNSQDPGKFVDSLASTGFGALRGERSAARGKFRSLLAQHFAVDAIGDRLIRRWRPRLSQAQYAQYKAAFPNFIIGAYADRLYDYSDASLKVVRVQNQGANAAVLTQVVRPGARPVQALWSVTRTPRGYQVTNLTVGGVNLAVTQAADFDSYVQKNGFDALVAFMKRRG